MTSAEITAMTEYTYRDANDESGKPLTVVELASRVRDLVRIVKAQQAEIDAFKKETQR